MGQPVSGTTAGLRDRPPLERDQELLRIASVLDDCVAGRGRVLLVEGPSGTGKTRLLEEARGMAADRDMDLLEARGGELEQTYDFGLVLDLLEARIVRAPAAERRQLLDGPAALAAPLLWPRARRSTQLTTTDEFTVLHGLYWCVRNLAANRGVAVLVDDLQWADRLSLRFLIYAAQRLSNLPVALIAAVRTGDPTPDPGLVAHFSSLGSGPPLQPAALSHAGVRALLAEAGLSAAESQDFVSASWEITGGNLYLLGELIAAIRHEPEIWNARAPADLVAFAPDSVSRSIVLRLARLGDEALKLTRACTVLGDDTPLALAAELAGLSLGDAMLAAERLVTAEVLRSANPVAFSHPMTRSALYAELPPEERLDIHLAVAKLLHANEAPPDRVAQHLVVGTTSHEPWVREVLRSGAREAARKGAPGTAVRYLRHALGLAGPGERSADVLLELGLVEAAAGETTALLRLEEALSAIDEPRAQAAALDALGQTLYRYGRQEEAATTFLEGAELFTDVDAELRLHFDAAFTCAAQGVLPMRAAVAARLEDLITSIPGLVPRSTVDRVILASYAHFNTLTRPRVDHHATLALRALGDGALLREESSTGMAIHRATMSLVWSGRPEEAEREIEPVLADARERGAAPAFAEASLVRAAATFAQGRLTEAAADAQATIDGIERGWTLTAPFPHAILALCLIERGQLERAEAVLEDAPLPLPAAGTPGSPAWIQWARGHLRLAQGSPQAALDDLLAMGRTLAGFHIANPAIMDWRTPASIAGAGIGDVALARQLAGDAARIAHEFGLPAHEATALRAMAVSEEPAAACATLRRAVALLEPTTARLWLAWALFDLGVALRRDGEERESREPLRRALDLAFHCGATVLEARARDELVSAGARPRRTAISGLDALTTREQAIAELVALGHSNRSIAERLFLTKSTVAWHLRNVYRKLDVTSRTALKQQLDQRPR